jgi:hypothetical protein
MAARKNPTYKRLNAVPRTADEMLKRTTIWLAEREREWLKAHGGIAPAIHGLIRDARRAEEGLVEKSAKPAAPVAEDLNNNFRR